VLAVLDHASIANGASSSVGCKSNESLLMGFRCAGSPRASTNVSDVNKCAIFCSKEVKPLTTGAVCCEFDGTATCTAVDVGPSAHNHAVLVAMGANEGVYAAICASANSTCQPSNATHLIDPTRWVDAGDVTPIVITLDERDADNCSKACEEQFATGVCTFSQRDGQCMLFALPFSTDETVGDMLTSLTDGDAPTRGTADGVWACSATGIHTDQYDDTRCGSPSPRLARVRIGTTSDFCPYYIPANATQARFGPSRNHTGRIVDRKLRIFRVVDHSTETVDTSNIITRHATRRDVLEARGLDVPRLPQCARTDALCAPAPCRLLTMSFFNDPASTHTEQDLSQLDIGNKNFNAHGEFLDVLGYSQCDPQFGMRVVDYENTMGNATVVYTATPSAITLMDHSAYNVLGVGPTLWPDKVPLPDPTTKAMRSRNPPYMYSKDILQYNRYNNDPANNVPPKVDAWTCNSEPVDTFTQTALAPEHSTCTESCAKLYTDHVCAPTPACPDANQPAKLVNHFHDAGYERVGIPAGYTRTNLSGCPNWNLEKVNGRAHEIVGPTNAVTCAKNCDTWTGFGPANPCTTFYVQANSCRLVAETCEGNSQDGFVNYVRTAQCGASLTAGFTPGWFRQNATQACQCNDGTIDSGCDTPVGKGWTQLCNCVPKYTVSGRRKPPPILWLQPVNVANSTDDFVLTSNWNTAFDAWRTAAAAATDEQLKDGILYAYPPNWKQGTPPLFDPTNVQCEGGNEWPGTHGGHVHSMTNCWVDVDNNAHGHFGARPTTYADGFALVTGYPQLPLVNADFQSMKSTPGGFSSRMQALGIIFPPTYAADFEDEKTNDDNFNTAMAQLKDMNPHIRPPTRLEWKQSYHDANTCHVFSSDAHDGGGCAWLPRPTPPGICPTQLAATLDDMLVPAHQSSATREGSEYGLFDFVNKREWGGNFVYGEARDTATYTCTNLWAARRNTHTAVRPRHKLECQVAKANLDAAMYVSDDKEQSTQSVDGAPARNNLYRYTPHAPSSSLPLGDVSIPFAVDLVCEGDRCDGTQSSTIGSDDNLTYTYSSNWVINADTKEDTFNEGTVEDEVLDNLRCGTQPNGALCTYDPQSKNTVYDLHFAEVNHDYASACPSFQCNATKGGGATNASTRSNLIRRANALLPTNITNAAFPTEHNPSHYAEGVACACCSHGDMWNTDVGINPGALSARFSDDMSMRTQLTNDAGTNYPVPAFGGMTKNTFFPWGATTAEGDNCVLSPHQTGSSFPAAFPTRSVSTGTGCKPHPNGPNFPSLGPWSMYAPCVCIPNDTPNPNKVNATHYITALCNTQGSDRRCIDELREGGVFAGVNSCAMLTMFDNPQNKDATKLYRLCVNKGPRPIDGDWIAYVDRTAKQPNGLCKDGQPPGSHAFVYRDGKLQLDDSSTPDTTYDAMAKAMALCHDSVKTCPNWSSGTLVGGDYQARVLAILNPNAWRITDYDAIVPAIAPVSDSGNLTRVCQPSQCLTPAQCKAVDHVDVRPLLPHPSFTWPNPFAISPDWNDNWDTTQLAHAATMVDKANNNWAFVVTPAFAATFRAAVDLVVGYTHTNRRGCSNFEALLTSKVPAAREINGTTNAGACARQCNAWSDCSNFYVKNNTCALVKQTCADDAPEFEYMNYEKIPVDSVANKTKYYATQCAGSKPLATNNLGVTGGHIATDVFYADDGSHTNVPEFVTAMQQREIMQWAMAAATTPPKLSPQDSVYKWLRAIWHNSRMLGFFWRPVTPHTPMKCSLSGVDGYNLDKMCVQGERAARHPFELRPQLKFNAVDGRCCLQAPPKPGRTTVTIHGTKQRPPKAMPPDDAVYSGRTLRLLMPGNGTTVSSFQWFSGQAADPAWVEEQLRRSIRHNVLKETPLVLQFPAVVVASGPAPAHDREWTSSMPTGINCGAAGGGKPEYLCELVTCDEAFKTYKGIAREAYLTANTNETESCTFRSPDMAVCGFRWPGSKELGLYLGASPSPISIMARRIFPNDVAPRSMIDALFRGSSMSSAALTDTIATLTFLDARGKHNDAATLPGTCTRWPFGHAHPDAFMGNQYNTLADAYSLMVSGTRVFDKSVLLRYCEMVQMSPTGTDDEKTTAYAHVHNDPMSPDERNDACTRRTSAGTIAYDAVTAGILLTAATFASMCSQVHLVCVYVPGTPAVPTLRRFMSMPHDFTGYTILVLPFTRAAFGGGFVRTIVSANMAPTPDPQVDGTVYAKAKQIMFDVLNNVDEYLKLTPSSNTKNSAVETIVYACQQYFNHRCPSQRGIGSTCFVHGHGDDMHSTTAWENVVPGLNDTNIVVRHSNVTIQSAVGGTLLFTGPSKSTVRTRFYVGAPGFTLKKTEDRLDNTGCVNGIECAAVVLTGDDVSDANIDITVKGSATALMALGASTPFFETSKRRTLVANRVTATIDYTTRPCPTYAVAVAATNGTLYVNSNCYLSGYLYEPYTLSRSGRVSLARVVSPTYTEAGRRRRDTGPNPTPYTEWTKTDVSQLEAEFTRVQEERVYHRSVDASWAVVAATVIAGVVCAMAMSLHAALFLRADYVAEHVVARMGLSLATSIKGEGWSTGDNTERRRVLVTVHGVKGAPPVTYRDTQVLAMVLAGAGAGCGVLPPSLIQYALRRSGRL